MLTIQTEAVRKLIGDATLPIEEVGLVTDPDRCVRRVRDVVEGLTLLHTIHDKFLSIVTEVTEMRSCLLLDIVEKMEVKIINVFLLSNREEELYYSIDSLLKEVVQGYPTSSDSIRRIIR